MDCQLQQCLQQPVSFENDNTRGDHCLPPHPIIAKADTQFASPSAPFILTNTMSTSTSSGLLCTLAPFSSWTQHAMHDVAVFFLTLFCHDNVLHV
jgi:hypothetical protein